MASAALYDDPRLYDLVVAAGPCEPFYCAQADAAAGPVLELACGTGRLTIPIALRGHAVIGLDSSRRMLQAARRKAAQCGATIRFVEGDMRGFSLDRLFALVIISCNSLAHLTTSAELRACFSAVRRHLAPGGALAFDIGNPDLEALASGGGLVPLAVERQRELGIAVEETVTYDPATQIRQARWRMHGAGGAVRPLRALRLRQIFPQELPLLLEAAGLRLVARFGDFEGRPFAGRSMNQVCIARAADD